MRHWMTFFLLVISADSACAEVELTEFYACVEYGVPYLLWETETETYNDFFEVRDGQLVVARVPGAGTSTEPQTYRITIQIQPPNVSSYYALYSVDVEGNHEFLDGCRAWNFPIYITQFEASLQPPAVQIDFTAACEIYDNWFTLVYHINRKTAESQEETIGYIHSPDCTAVPRAYQYFDSTALPNTSYTYVLRASIGFDWDYMQYLFATDTITTLPLASPRPRSVAAEYSVGCFPNPFNPSTTLSFSLPRASNTRLAVFDILGREIAVLTDKLYPTGEHRLIFDGSALPSGLYFARIQSGDYIATHKLLLLK